MLDGSHTHRATPGLLLVWGAASPGSRAPSRGAAPCAVSAWRAPCAALSQGFWLDETTSWGFGQASLVPAATFCRVLMQGFALGLRSGVTVVLVPFSSLWAGGVLAAPVRLPSRWAFPSHLPLPLPPGEGKEREEEEEKRHRRAERGSCLPSRRRGRGDGGVGDKRQRGGDGRGGRR